MHDRNSFVTLTYRTECLPKDWLLDHDDFRRFMKAWRKRRGRSRPIRYFMCGEYGDEGSRPHFHFACFGEDFRDDRVPIKERRGYTLFTSPSLESQWGKGFVTVGALTWQSAAYVARYVCKKMNGPLQEDHYGFVDPGTGEWFPRRPEYATMSRRPGIGAAWLHKFMSDVYPRDEVISKGVPARPPKYYDDLFGRLNPDGLDEIKSRRKVKGSKHKTESHERREVRERVLKKRLARKKGSL